ncbi:MAG: hypothetical protein RID91_13760 [Azospirillaceae bacterium]
MVRILDSHTPGPDTAADTPTGGPRLVVDNAAARRGAATPLARAGLPPEFARLVEVHGAAALRASARGAAPRPSLAVDNGSLPAPARRSDAETVEAGTAPPARRARAGEGWWWEWADQD